MKKKKVVVKVTALDGSSVHEIDVTQSVATSRYPHFLSGILQKVDLTRFVVDHEAADAEHERLMEQRRRTDAT